MQLTTPQLYALALMAVLTVALIGISYVSGLRTGRKAGEEAGYENGRRTAASYWKTIIAGNRESHSAAEQKLLRKLDETRADMEQHIAEASGLRKQLAANQTITERLDRTIQRLLPKAFHSEDLLTLNLAARQLGITAKAHARSGTNKPNQAELAQQALKEIVARVSASGPDVPHPDTELLNWLEENATVNFELETATLQFLCCPGSEIGVKSTRELLEWAMFESEQINAEAAA